MLQWWPLDVGTLSPFTEIPRHRDPLQGPEATWDQAARQEVTSYRDLPPVNRQT